MKTLPQTGVIPRRGSIFKYPSGADRRPNPSDTPLAALETTKSARISRIGPTPEYAPRTVRHVLLSVRRPRPPRPVRVYIPAPTRRGDARPIRRWWFYPGSQLLSLYSLELEKYNPDEYSTFAFSVALLYIALSGLFFLRIVVIRMDSMYIQLGGRTTPRFEAKDRIVINNSYWTLLRILILHGSVG